MVGASARAEAGEAKELIPIIVAAVIRGQNWKGGKILAHCDNAAVVAVLNS